MIIEYLFITSLFAAGYVLIRVAGLGDLERVVLAMPVGIVAYAIITYTQIILGLPTYTFVTLSILCAICIYVIYLGRNENSKPNIFYIGSWLAFLLFIVALVGSFSLVKYHYDSIRYLIVGSMIGQDEIDLLTRQILRTRLSILSILHSSSHLNEGLYLKALSPAIAINVLLAVYVFAYKGISSSSRDVFAYVAAGAAAIWLLSINRFVWNAFYINGHLLEALYLLVLAGSAWLCALGKLTPRATFVLQAVSIFGVVLSRPEGFILAGLVLLPTLLSDLHAARARMALGATWGIAIVVQQSAILVHHFASRSLNILVLGLIILAVSPILRSGIFARHTHRLLVLAATLPCLVLALFIAMEPSIFLDSAFATFANVVAGRGGWGASLVVLVVLVAISLGVTNAPERYFLWFPVLSFVPVAFILAYLRDEAYRVGVTDSLNRMIFHFVPLAVLLVASAAVRPNPSPAKQEPDTP